ncbi:hypothetical protein [Vibrio sp. 10N.222.52.C12]|uniref:hypothetical protein n=1 Tax=Vibrio sp. 10N.222.52.C12 TaxID=3229630 RepID=UPI00354D01D2
MLKVRQRISEKQAKKMILDLVRKSDHSSRSHTDTLNNKQIEAWFNQNQYPFKQLVTSSRDFKVSIPFVENILPTTVHVSGGETSVIDANGDVQASINGAGSLNMSDYQGKFESAMKYRDRAIQHADIEEYYSCLSKLFASLESYFNYKALVYNQTAADKLIDSKQSPVPLEDKIRDWIPILAPGNKVDRGNRCGQLFKLQLLERNNQAIHPKSPAQATSYADLAQKLNELRDGVIKLTYDIYSVLEVEMKSQVIRSVYHPDVYTD